MATSAAARLVARDSAEAHRPHTSKHGYGRGARVGRWLRCPGVHPAKRRPGIRPALIGHRELDRRLRRPESPDPVSLHASAQDKAISDVRYALAMPVEPGRRRDSFGSPIAKLRRGHERGVVRGNVRRRGVERFRLTERGKLNAIRRWRLRQDPVFQSEHLGPFREGTLWRTRGQEITDSGVYQVEAGDPEGHPWLMSIIVAVSDHLSCQTLSRPQPGRGQAPSA
jgi:hypothetical protein